MSGDNCCELENTTPVKATIAIQLWQIMVRGEYRFYVANSPIIW